MDKTKVVLELISIKDDVRDAIPSRLKELKETVDQKVKNIIKELLDGREVILSYEVKEPFKPCPPIENQKGDADEN